MTAGSGASEPGTPEEMVGVLRLLAANLRASVPEELLAGALAAELYDALGGDVARAVAEVQAVGLRRRAKRPDAQG